MKQLVVGVAIMLSLSASQQIGRLHTTIEELEEVKEVQKKELKKIKDEIGDKEEEIEKSRQHIEEQTQQIKETTQKIEEQEEQLKKLEDEVERKEKQEVKQTSSTPPKPQENKGGQGTLIGTFEATGYCPCSICNGKWTGSPTASGTPMVAGRTIAVDPRVIPLGSTVHIEGLGDYVAEDTGSAIKGRIIDIYFNSHQEALQWGRRKVTIYRK